MSWIVKSVSNKYWSDRDVDWVVDIDLASKYSDAEKEKYTLPNGSMWIKIDDEVGDCNHILGKVMSSLVTMADLCNAKEEYTESGFEEMITIKLIRFAHCPTCGSRLDWEDISESLSFPNPRDPEEIINNVSKWVFDRSKSISSKKALFTADKYRFELVHISEHMLDLKYIYESLTNYKHAETNYKIGLDALEKHQNKLLPREEN